MIKDKYKSFTVSFDESYMDEEWIISEKDSTDTKLVFLGYDANLFPMSLFGSRDMEQEHNKIIIEKALEATEDFDGEVYLDDYKIK